jgi:hypothetical protein
MSAPSPVIKGDNTILWGTSAGTTMAGLIVSVKDQLTGEIVEVPDDNGFATSVVFFNDKHECEADMIIQTAAPTLARGTFVTIMGNANCMVTDITITWEQKGMIDTASAVRDSGGSKTPKAVLNAFAPDKIIAGDMELQPVTMSVMLQLQKLESGLLKTDADFSIRDIANALFVLTTPIKVVRDLLSHRAPDGSFPKFAAAVDLMADEVPVKFLPQIGKTINRALTEAFSTLVPHGVEKGTNPDSPFPEARTPDPGMAGS